MHTQTDRALRRAHRFARRHRRSIVAATLAGLCGFAITAVAIAPLAPDAAMLPQRLVQQPVQQADLSGQIDALAIHDFTLDRSDVTRASDSAESLLGRLGVSDASAALFLRTDSTGRLVLAGRGGKMVQARMTSEGRLQELIVRSPAERPEQARTHFTRTSISRVGGRWLARLQSVPLSAQVRLASGTIRSTLYAATDDARLPDPVAAQLAEIFATEIDFHRELRRGDTFSLVYEALTADGEPVVWNEGAGRILAAEFVNAGQAHHALWFANTDGKGTYFGLDGSSKKRSFLASPMAFSRITSGFAMRFHPIQQQWRRHLGVDYGAPSGTPVRTVGDGVVDFAGWQNGYGNVVQIQHGKDHTTLYAHLSSVGVHTGQKVEQGQLVGAVGSTGWSTGPHLHFEFRVRGEHQDPIHIAKASETLQLDASSRARFAGIANALRGQLRLAGTVAIAATERTE